MHSPPFFGVASSPTFGRKVSDYLCNVSPGFHALGQHCTFLNMAPPRKKPRVSDVVSEDKDEEMQVAPPAAPETAASKDAEDPNAEPQRQRRQLFVRSLPASTTTESLTELFSQNYPIKHATAVLNKETKQCKGFGFVTFADAEDAARAKEEFNGHVIDGKKIRIEIAEHRQRDEKGVSQKPERVKESDKKDEGHLESGTKLIVRNLPWSIKHNSHLEKLFLSYGKVKSAQVVKKRDGLLTGFGFVTMRGRKNAEKAIEGVNGMEINGRTIAVDWAVERAAWKDLKEDAEEKESSADEQDEVVDDQSQITDDGGEGNTSDEDEDGDLADGEFDENDLNSQPVQNKSEDRSCTLFVRNLPFTCTDEDLEDHFTQFGATRYARVVLDSTTERPKGTGFVCFYNTADADECVKGAPRQTVAKPADGKTKGAAAPQTHSLLQDENLDPAGRYTLEGRVLQISRAVDKSEANRLTQEGVAYRFKRDTDKRRLYLLSEGTIASNSALWESLSPSEQAMREASAKQRKTIIESNPSLNLSLTRLSVRNIPRTVTSKDLKQLAREAVVGFATDLKEGKRQRLSKEELSRGGEEMAAAEKARKTKAKGLVRQAKIVFESEGGSKVEERLGAGRSRGYGFIEYYTHRSALMGLRWLNGHLIDYKAQGTEKQGKGKNMTREVLQERKKRLIVEFAIENAQVVVRRKDRETKAKEYAKNPQAKEDDEQDKDAKVNGVTNRQKRKRGVGNAAAEEDEDSSKPVDEKLAKRQRIIQRKRAVRREKKKGGKA